MKEKGEKKRQKQKNIRAMNCQLWRQGLLTNTLTNIVNDCRLINWSMLSVPSEKLSNVWAAAIGYFLPAIQWKWLLLRKEKKTIKNIQTQLQDMKTKLEQASDRC